MAINKCNLSVLVLARIFSVRIYEGGGKKGFLLSFTSPGFCLAALGSKHWVMGGDHHPPPRPVLESALRPPGAVHDEDK